MDEKKPCVRCNRAIDAWAKICPFCNQDQDAPVPTRHIPPAPVTDYKPPSEFDLKRKAIMLGAGALLLIVSFAVGVVINRDDTPKNAPQTVEQQLAEEAAQAKVPPVRRADTSLVPTNEPGGIEQPITSAPATGAGGTVPDEYQRSDATAVSATEYAEMARRAKAEKEKMAVLVDPRSITGPAYAGAQRPATQAPVARRASTQAPAARTTPPVQRRATTRTRPVPEYQPLPSIPAGSGRARLSLMIGADGHVKRVDIQQPLQRRNADLVNAVQSWRFKPATENGEPVAARYSVEISFNP